MRLANFYISVGTKFTLGDFNPATFTICQYQDTALGSSETKISNCSLPIRGRYVAVYFPSTKSEILSLCEVTVYGEFVQGGIGTEQPLFVVHNFEISFVADIKRHPRHGFSTQCFQ